MFGAAVRSRSRVRCAGSLPDVQKVHEDDEDRTVRTLQELPPGARESARI